MLDPDQARRSVKLSDTLIVFLKELFKSVDFEKKSTADDKNACKISQEANTCSLKDLVHTQLQR